MPRKQSGRAQGRQLWATVVATAQGHAAVAASAYGVVACNWHRVDPQDARQELEQVLTPVTGGAFYDQAQWLEEAAGLPPHLAAARVALRCLVAGDHDACACLELDTRARPHFTARVLRCVQAIPAGSVLSYQEVAVRAGSPKAARAAGQVMATNPLAPIVPCHRVIAARGRPGGFGPGVARKLELLQTEGVTLREM